MNILVSHQDTGTIKVVKISKKSNDMLHVDIKGELCHLNINGNNNYVAKILTFQSQNVSYLVILRKSGSIQLYSKNPNVRYYNLFKDWKSNLLTTVGDEVIALGIIDSQYLYSCSREGKLIIRDLINDDADQSYKVYIVGNNIGKVDLKLDRFKNTLGVAICGKNCDLKLYEIDLNLDVKGNNGPIRELSELSYVGVMRNRPLQRSFTTLNLNAWQERPVASFRSLERNRTRSLCHYWKSTTEMDQYVYNPNNLERISQWMSSVCFMEGSELIVCGSQVGELVIYDPCEDTDPVFTRRISQFSIKTIKQMDDDYIIFSDSISRVGIFQLSTRELVLEYLGLEFGPFLSLEYILPNIPKRKVSGSRLSFEEIYVLASTVDKRVIVYKLLDNGANELLLDIKLFESLIPSISVLQSVSEYCQFRAVFGETDHKGDANICKKRKVAPNLAIPISSAANVKSKIEDMYSRTRDCTESPPALLSSSDSESEHGEFIHDSNVQKILLKQ